MTVTPTRPFFSIIIPTFNRPRELAACLQSLKGLDYSRDRFEVIVVDDGSGMPLEPVVHPFIGLLDLSLIRQQNGGPASARNRGAPVARGEFLIFTDDDCALSPDFLWRLEVRIADAPECAVGGRTINAVTGNLYSTASQLMVDYLYARYNAVATRARFFTSNNMAVPSNYFKSIGSFDTSYRFAAGEDRDFFKRWLSQGLCMIYAPEVKVYHSHRLTFSGFCRQHFKYGRGAYRFHFSATDHGERRVKMESFPFYLKLLCYPFTRAKGLHTPCLLTLMAISQLATALGYWVEKASSRHERRS
ncbi:MAG: glycosyltransferase [Pseudomonadota bacterium]